MTRTAPRYAKVSTVVVVVVMIPATLGLIIGWVTAGSGDASDTAAYLDGDVALAYSAGWRAVRDAPAIPGLKLSRPEALAPQGKTTKAGFVLGHLRPNGPYPLPSQLVDRLVRPSAPRIVVSIQDAGAYRYDAMQLSGSDLRETLYVFPGTQDETIVACYATPAALRFLATCQRIAEGVQFQFVDSVDPTTLAPLPAYARALTRAIDRLNARRAFERARIRARVSAGKQARAAIRLSTAYAATETALRRATVPVAAVGANEVLIGALRQARTAYLKLGSAAQERSPRRWLVARSEVAAAERSVRLALRGLVTLGYAR
jgi:hypothetical protein